MLAAAGSEEAPAPEQGRPAPTHPTRLRRNIGLWLMALGVPALAIALYLTWGSPGLPSRPFVEGEHWVDMSRDYTPPTPQEEVA